MVGLRKTSRTLGEHAFFGDEEAAQLRSELDELRVSVAELTDRVHAQFTTIAAHAEIAREQAEFARAEARSDLERTRETLIELIESLRTDAAVATHVTGSAPGPSTRAQTERIGAVETTVGQLADTVDRCFARQTELADTMTAFLDTMLADQRGEPVAGLSLS